MKSEKVTTRYGVMSIPVSDAVLGPSLRQYGEWAQDEIEGLVQLLKDGDVVIDAGANIGTHTLGLVSAVSPRGRVYSFEPQLEIFDLLRQNCEASVFAPNIQPYCHPLSSVSGQKFSIPLLDAVSIHNFGAIHLSPKKSDERPSYDSHESMTIDDLHLDACRLIKLDVEGMELEVLNGAKRLIKKHKPLIFFEANTISDAWKIIEEVTPWGNYSARVVISNAFSSRNFNHNQQNIFSDFQETSILLVGEQEDALAGIAFNNSIRISNYAQLAIALALLCRRPPGHPLADLTTHADDIKNTYHQDTSVLSASILHELIYQKNTRAALTQQHAALAQQHAALTQQHATLTQQNTALVLENTALSDRLNKYPMFPIIRLMRKARDIIISFIHFGKH